MKEQRESPLWDNSLSQFRDRVAAATPTPGGGAVAAVSATFAAALLQMVCAISAKRYGEQKTDAIAANVKVVEVQLAQSAEEDIRAFDRYLATRKVRSESSDRDAQRCLLECTEVPLAAAEAVVKLEAYATELIPDTPEILMSELATARYLLDASRKALLASVQANLKGLVAGEAREAMVRRLMALGVETD